MVGKNLHDVGNMVEASETGFPGNVPTWHKSREALEHERLHTLLQTVPLVSMLVYSLMTQLG